MTVKETDTPQEYDPRIPNDRSDVTEPGEYYAHIMTALCNIHGKTACRCVHSLDNVGDCKTELRCLRCQVTEK